jgi:hypothetical protein
MAKKDIKGSGGIDLKQGQEEAKYIELPTGQKRPPGYWNSRLNDWEKLFKNQEENAKNGRPKAFSSPSHFWATAVKYFELTDGAPWLKKDYKGKDAIEVDIPTQSPYLWAGFDDFCLQSGICASAKDYRTASRNEDYRSGMYADFAEVVRAVDDIMKGQKISGAIVGTFNPNIVARLEGLADKTENEVTVKETRVGFE